MRAARGALVLSLAAAAIDSRPLATVTESGVRPIAWKDVGPLRAELERHGLSSATFATRIQEIRRANARRVQEGDLDHLIFYLLQSTRFASAPAIEPALSAKAFVDTGRVPDDVRLRTKALLRAVDSDSADPRLVYFRELVASAFPDRGAREAALLREYERVMRFVHEKEFVAQRSPRAADAVAELYRTRGLSTDTAVEAGYLVHQGLGVLQGLSPDRRIRRVLIVGPGLDLAPRTGLIEEGPPESYQPWAVIDALLSLGLSRIEDLDVVAADINARVVSHLRRARERAPVLALVSGITETETVKFSDDYRAYFGSLGGAVGEIEKAGGGEKGSMRKRVRVRAEVARAMHTVRLDAVTERLQGPPFDLVVATNILPYFGEVELMLAMSNVAAMLAPGGVFLHNEPRPSLGEITTAVGLPFNQLRRASIATVRTGPPLVDTVFVHLRAEASQGRGLRR